jgi:hypothetical protein
MVRSFTFILCIGLGDPVGVVVNSLARADADCGEMRVIA